MFRWCVYQGAIVLFLTYLIAIVLISGAIGLILFG